MKDSILLVILANIILEAAANSGWGWNDADPYFSTTGRPTGPSRPTTSTPNANFRRCLKRCPSTGEYNPVCGSDNVIYNNEGKFLCAKYCGAKIEKLYNGVCTPPVTTTSASTSQSPVTANPICFKKCPRTSEYNPVCGSDNVTYRNEGDLLCAQQCGLRVQKLFSGTCPTATSSTSVRSTIPTRVTTPPNFRACIRQCIVSGHYVPVCATDGTTYDNESLLMCDIECGKNISKQRSGIC